MAAALPGGAANSAHLELGKHKLVRARPTLLAQLRERAVISQTAAAPGAVAAPGGRALALAVQQNHQTARRSNTWTRPQQQQQT